MTQIKQLSSETIKKILNWDDVMAAVQTAMLNVTKGRVIQNPRCSTQIPHSRNMLLTMPGYLHTDEFSALGCKLVSVFPDNVKENLPTIMANILLFNEKTGALEVIMDGTEITLWRTAAASVVATKYIRGADGKYDILAIVGTGAQARIHAIAFQEIFKFPEVRVWGRNYAKAEKLCTELNLNYKGHFVPYEKLNECLDSADVLVTATFAKTPLVRYEWLKQGFHINAVGAVGKFMELDEETYKSAITFVDHLSGADHELQHLLSRGIQFEKEIGAIINGSISPPASNENTIFQGLGMAAEDCAVAKIVYKNYMKSLA